MRFRIGFALLLSIVLISGAAVIRVSNQNTEPSSIISVENPVFEATEYDYIATSDVTNGAEEDSDTQLSSTDLVGRQLLADYLNLAASGQATEGAIVSLANQYVDMIPTIGKTTYVGITEIDVVSNDKRNFETYVAAVTRIRQVLEFDVYKLEPVTTPDSVNDELFSFALKMSQAYDKAAQELLKVSVPNGITAPHLKLLNNYFSNAASFNALAKANDDSASAFAGLVLLNENIVTETSILREINKVLAKYGV